MADGRFERELVNTLDEATRFVVMRAPSSGSATTRDLPDVLALRRDEPGGLVRSEALAVEAKSTSKNAIYVEPHEVEALERFADEAGATALLGARFKRNGYDRVHYLVPPERAGRTQGDGEGNYSVHIDDAADVAEWVVNATECEVRRA